MTEIKATSVSLDKEIVALIKEKALVSGLPAGRYIGYLHNKYKGEDLPRGNFNYKQEKKPLGIKLEGDILNEIRIRSYKEDIKIGDYVVYLLDKEFGLKNLGVDYTTHK